MSLIIDPSRELAVAFLSCFSWRKFDHDLYSSDDIRSVLEIQSFWSKD